MTIENQDLEEGKSIGQKMMDDAKSAADKAADEAKKYSSRKMEEGRDRAAGELGKVAHAAATAASDLEGQQQETISHYVNEMADRVNRLAEGLRGKSVDQLIDDAKTIARKNPALFIAGSVAIGIGLSRFVKASARRAEEQSSATGDFTARSENSTSEDRAPW